VLRRLKLNRTSLLVRRNLRLARSKWGRRLDMPLQHALEAWSKGLKISIEAVTYC
jgi:hypothetical protein